MLLFIDYESYWDRQVTLKKLTPPEYIFHRQFHVHGASFKNGVTGKSMWFDAEKLPGVFASLDPAKTAICYFNALFDQCITSWVYGFTPALIIDAMGMARALYGHKFTRFSLANVAAELGLGAKGDEVANTCGKTRDELRADPEFWARFQSYCNNDNDLCAGVYAHCLPRFPMEQFAWMDLVLRCAIQPQLKLNRHVCVMHRRAARKKKWDILRACGSDRPDLMSTTKFCALLEAAGVQVEMKDSPADIKKGKLPRPFYDKNLDLETDKSSYCRQIPAIAKTDEFMARLLDSDDQYVAALAGARLGVRSTQAETRAARFAALARLPTRYEPGRLSLGLPPKKLYRAGSAPIALRYGAAHTHRLGGEWKLNFQNLARGGVLRNAIECWPGDVMLAPDYSQIEARMVAWLAGQDNLVQMFRDKADVYSFVASVIFGYKVDRKLRDSASKLVFETEGFIGKTSVLGLGYNMGPDRFCDQVHTQARSQLGRDIEFDIAQAIRTVNAYRRELFPLIPQLWGFFERLLDDLQNPTPKPGWRERFPFLQFEHEAVVLPSGMRLTYHNLRRTRDGFRYDFGLERYRGPDEPDWSRFIYGGKVLENLCQALAGIIVQEAAVRLWHKYKIRFAMQSHDELVFVCRELDVETVRRLVVQEMTVVPSWAPGLPLAIELKAGTSYGNVTEWKDGVSWDEFKSKVLKAA
jgi:DNA polymerase